MNLTQELNSIFACLSLSFCAFDWLQWVILFYWCFFFIWFFLIRFFLCLFFFLHKLRFQFYFFDEFTLIRPFCLFISLVFLILLGLLLGQNFFFGWYLGDMLWHSSIQIVGKSINRFIDSIKLLLIKNVNSWIDLKPKIEKIHELYLGV